MSSWITNGLKSLRIRVGGAVGSVPQQRSPPHFGAQMKEKEVEIPPRPKKPLTPYFRFMGQVRSEVKRLNPTLKPTEVTKVIAQRWEKLDDSSKEKYMSSYKNEMASYSTIIEKYKNSLTPEQIQAQHQLKLDKQLMKEKRDRKKRLRDLGKPKKPVTAFGIYLNEKVPKGSSIETYQNAAKSLSEVWKCMSESEKAPYMEKYQQALKLFQKELAAWEDKMLKQGHEDLVRISTKSSLASTPARSSSKK